MTHSDAHVRAWAVRMTCDAREVSAKMSDTLARLATRDPSIEVRKQLASSAKRLSPSAALPILWALIEHDEDVLDIHQPLLVWWAFEASLDARGRALVLKNFQQNPTLWSRPFVHQHLTQRFMKRLALAGSREELRAAAALLNAANTAQNAEAVKLLLGAFEEAYQGRSLHGIPDELVSAIAAAGGGSLRLRLRQGDPEAIQVAIKTIADDEADHTQRLEFMRIGSELRHPEFVPPLLTLLAREENNTLVAAALAALQAFRHDAIGSTIVERLPTWEGDTRRLAEAVLASRREWALALLEAVDGARLSPEDVSKASLLRLSLHDDPQIRELVRTHWGAIAGPSTQELRREIEHFTSVLRLGSGNPKQGKPLFMKRCGNCHSLFGEGGDLGPDLTSFQRDDLPRVLVNVVDPSAEIREGFEQHIVLTSDGQIVHGFLADQDNQVVVLRDTHGQRFTFRRNEIEERYVSPVSLMPLRTLNELSEQQLRDLFAYLRSSQPVNY